MEVGRWFKTCTQFLKCVHIYHIRGMHAKIEDGMIWEMWDDLELWKFVDRERIWDWGNPVDDLELRKFVG